MSTGFFKDITGGNNKFLPRSFQFNLGHNDFNSKGSPDSSVISTCSTAPTKDCSTAPSTDTSSKYFHSNTSTDPDPAAAAGGKPIATFLLDELSLESITDEPRSSGVKRLEVAKSAQPIDEEDDLEITEIRDATADPDSSKIQEISTYTGGGQRSEQTSSDLLLEALYKSQQVCTSLKGNLEDANVKISLQEEQIESNKKNFETMKTNFKNFKTNLYLIEKNTKDLVDSKAAESARIKEFKTEHQAVVDSLRAFKEEIPGLRKKVEGLKQLKNATSFEIERRNKDINTLQKKLDETSGFLSEQKIRTLQLEKILEESRKSYDARMEKVNEQTAKFQEQLMKSIKDSDSHIGSKIKSLFESEMKPLLGTVSSDIFAKVNDLGENFSKALTLADKSLSEQVTSSVNAIREGFKNSQKSNEFLGSKLGTIVNNQESVNVTLQIIIKKCEEVIDNTGNIPPGCNDELSSLSKQLELLKSQIQKQTDETKRCDTLNEKLAALSKELTNSLATIKQLDTIVNERDKEIGELKANSEELTLRQSELTDKVESLESAILTKEITFKDSEEKFQKSKSVIESKLKTQMEIYRMVAQERDDVKALLESTKLDLTKTLETQASTIEELKGEKEKLKKEANQAKEEIQQLKSEVVALEGRNLTLTYNLEQQSKELEARPVIKHYIEQSKSEEPEPFLDKIDDIIYSTPTPKPGPKRRPTILDEPSTSNKATAKVVKAAKPPPASKAKTRIKSTAPLPSSAALSKRKKLLDDDEDMSFIFDRFDLDTISDEVPTLPKKYTKRKKTKV